MGTNVLCRGLTTFSKTLDLDEESFRKYLRRMVEAGIGLYLGSGGSGEGHALSKAELLRVYQLGVEVCKGKVTVGANLPDQHTPQATIEHARVAIEAGVDVINLYGPASHHGYSSTAGETVAYFDRVLSAIEYPVAIAPNVMIPTPSASLIAEVCNRYPQITTVMMMSQDDHYFITLREKISRDIEINVPFGLLHALLLGANGVITNQASILPRTFRTYVDLFDAKDFSGLGPVFADLVRFGRYVDRWGGSPRWLKMALRVLKLPGGEGGVREPYIAPTDQEVREFVDGLLALRIPELDELARAAGLRFPESVGA